MRIIFPILLLVFLALAAYGYWRYRARHDTGSYLLALISTVLATIMLLFLTSFLVFLFLGLAVSAGFLLMAKRHAPARWRKAAMLGCSALALFLAVGNLAYQSRGCQAERLGSERLRQEGLYQEIMMETLGQYLARHYPGGRILLIANELDRFWQQKEEALERGLGKGAIIQKRVVPIPASIRETRQPADRLFNANTLDNLVNQNPSCNMVVSLLPLPDDALAVTYWNKPANQRPTTVVLLDSVESYRPYLEDGRLSVAIAPNPQGSFLHDKPLPVDRQVAFSSRYVILDHRELATVKP